MGWKRAIGQASSTVAVETDVSSPIEDDEQEADIYRVPTNYAYNENSGYDGLLLYTLAPRFAEKVYPWVATEGAEAVLGIMSLVPTVLSTVPLITARVPISWTKTIFITWGVVVQRLAVLDLRLFRLLLRNFETYFLLANLLITIIMQAMGFAAPGVILYSYALAVAILPTVVLDSIRLPAPALKGATSSFAVVGIFWLILHQLQLSPKQAYNYDAKILGVPMVSIYLGRGATLSLFYLRYSFNLRLHPEAFVMLRRPVLVRKLEGTNHSTVLHKLCSRRLADLALPWLTHPIVELSLMALSILGVVVALLALFPLPPMNRPVFPSALAQASLLLLHLPSLQRILLMDLQVIQRLLRYFDTFWLVGNLIVAFACLGMGMFKNSLATTAVLHSVLSSASILLLDAVCLPVAAKLRALWFYSALSLTGGVAVGLQLSYHQTTAISAMGDATLFFSRMNLPSMFASRLITLGIYWVRYAVKLHLRPDTYVCVTDRLSRYEEDKRMLSTLRSAANPLVALEA